MRTVAVTAPDGTEWAVRVAWEPRWPLLVRRFGGWRDKRREKKRGSGVDVGDAASGAVNIGFEMPDDLVAALLVRTRKRHVIGWRAALRTRDALAEHLRTGAPMDSVIQPG